MVPQHLWHLCTYRQNKHLCHQLNHIMKCLGWAAKPSICTSGTEECCWPRLQEFCPPPANRPQGAVRIMQWRRGPAVPTFIPLNSTASAPALPFCLPHILLRHCCCCTGTVIPVLWRISTTPNTTGAAPYSLQAVPGLIWGMWAQHPPSVPIAGWIHQFFLQACKDPTELAAEALPKLTSCAPLHMGEAVPQP